MQRSRRFQFGLRFLFLLTLISAVGVYFWGRQKPAAVSGAITVNGKPLNTATVIFRSSTGDINKVDTGPNGKYEMQLPPGEYSVGIESKLTSKRHASPQSSGLRVAIVEGENVVEIELSQ